MDKMFRFVSEKLIQARAVVEVARTILGTDHGELGARTVFGCKKKKTGKNESGRKNGQLSMREGEEDTVEAASCRGSTAARVQLASVSTSLAMLQVGQATWREVNMEGRDKGDSLRDVKREGGGRGE